MTGHVHWRSRMLRRTLVTFSAICILAGATACSSSAAKPITSTGPTSPADGGGAKARGGTKPKSTPKTGALKSRAGATPPKDATSQGIKSSPKAGGLTVPITEVEVFVFAFDFDGDGTEESINWAYADGTTYLWLTGA